MIFQIFSTSGDGSEQLFTLHIYTIETGLDVISQLVSRGVTVTRVRLGEDGHWIELPVEAFDGQDFSGKLLALQQEWQQILTPSGNTESIVTRADLLRDRINLITNSITQLERTVEQLEELLIRASQHLEEGVVKQSLINYYISALGVTHRFIARRQYKISQLKSELNHLSV